MTVYHTQHHHGGSINHDPSGPPNQNSPLKESTLDKHNQDHDHDQDPDQDQDHNNTENNPQEGGRFEAEYINNKHYFPTSLVFSQFEDEDETRDEHTPPNLNIANNDTPSPRSATLDTNTNVNSTKAPVPSDDGEALNISLEDGTLSNYLPPPTQDELPLPPTMNEEDDANEVPTWLRKLSIFQSYSFNNDLNSHRWKDIKQAFKDKFRKDSQAPFQPARNPIFPESEAQARMRASNLITSLLAGSPAALFAGMSFTTDERNDRRAPLLLSLMGVEVKDISATKGHHKKFQIDLEYGVGDNRLKWSIVRDLRSLVGLHSRLKVSLFQFKKTKGRKFIELPKFPKFKDENYHEENKGVTLNDKYLTEIYKARQGEEFQTVQENQNNLMRKRQSQVNPSNDNLSSNNSVNSPVRHSSPHHTVHIASDNTSISNHSNNTLNSGGGGFIHRIHSIISRTSSNEGDRIEDELLVHHETFRKRIELYVKHLIANLSLQPQANRLFQFFELSPIGVLLSYETGYQGKQGYLIVGTSAKAQGWRVGHLKFSDFKQMVQRHTTKWFLIRGSYIMYVSGIYSTTPLEVFLVDSDFKVTFAGKGDSKLENLDNESIYDDAISLDDRIEGSHNSVNILSTHFAIKLENGERSMKMFARSENQAKLWVRSIETMRRNTIWANQQRFGSFSPVRNNCYAQWFVDGRDHFWAIASALELAKDVIYIHDWWLSPELYLRRPANGNQEWRLDRVLKRKAEEGVKIFVIVYRNVANTVITDSLWTKHSLIDLHPNIHVLRSPTQWLQNTYFWAHHEKLCIIDHAVAFVGGIDLCFGRYDTPDHVLVDDAAQPFAKTELKAEETIKYQNFPGKDYSNPRVKDFFELDRPDESMYDRQVTPRMPWHDVHMMTAGQPASDLSRHFVQRWNYILRQKRPSRPTPLLTPPPEWNNETLKRFNLSGTCEVQIVRSSGAWSLGLKETECSIQNAYLKLIETSEHFVYMENQFFITATAFDGTVIANRIGDALVDRIIRAHNEKKPWRAVIVIPLMPGFEAQVDEADGSAVRVIMKCQYMSISRGEASIFGKLQKMNINPYDYIQFFSLRKWGRIGPARRIVTEQLYIHAKILIVDDRTALIGSANINERSQRGSRDSEVCAVVRDTEVVETTMAGKHYKAGRFAHTLRMRLMREHVGIDVDTLEIVEKRFTKIEELAAVNTEHKTHNFSNREFEVASSKVELASRDVLNLPDGTEKWKKYKQQTSNPQSSSSVSSSNIKLGENKLNLHSSVIPPTLIEEEEEEVAVDSNPKNGDQKIIHELPKPLFIHSFNNRAREENLGIREKKHFSGDSRISNNAAHKQDVEGRGVDRMGSKEFCHHKSDAARTLRKWAEESLANDKTKLFLPNVQQVTEFLDEDNILGGNVDLTKEQELWVHERNQERWNMLKRITYLQRVAAKQQIQIDEENVKRSKTGLSNLSQKVSNTGTLDSDNSGSGVSGDTSVANNVIPENGVKKEVSQSDPVCDQNVSLIDTTATESPPMGSAPASDSNATATEASAREFALSGLDQVEEIQNLPGHNIPVVSLDTAGIREILAKTTYNPESINDTKFIDPYCFADPLEESFYEDIWFDIALKNTLIFREVFHCQPDDTVTTWKQYKDFTRLGTAFNLAQDQEITARERDLSTKKRPGASTTDNTSDIGNDTRSVNIEEIDEEISRNECILGNSPPTTESTGKTEGTAATAGTSSATPISGRRTKSSIYGLRKKITRGDNERVFDIATCERLLDEVQGHLVLFPVDWLYKEIDGGNWFYNMDRIPPIEIYD